MPHMMIPFLRPGTGLVVAAVRGRPGERRRLPLGLGVAPYAVVAEAVRARARRRAARTRVSDHHHNGDKQDDRDCL